VIAPVQPTDQGDFEQPADQPGDDDRGRHGDPERSARLRYGGRDIGADHVERTVREVHHVHDAEHQRQAGGNQEQHQPELQAVQQLFDEERRGHRAPLRPRPYRLTSARTEARRCLAVG
jgi:hypothetical protein